MCLNPYCSGQWSRTIRHTAMSARQIGLNPCCSGQWSRTTPPQIKTFADGVLILVVVDNGHVLPITIKTIQL